MADWLRPIATILLLALLFWCAINAPPYDPPPTDFVAMVTYHG